MLKHFEVRVFVSFFALSSAVLHVSAAHAPLPSLPH